MSRLGTLSPAARRAMFSPDADDDLITLLTIDGVGIAQPVRLADNYLLKFEYLTAASMTVTDIETNADWAYTYAPDDAVLKEAVNTDRHNALYGVRSSGIYYLFIPFNPTLPSEENGQAPRASLTVHDVTRQVLPIIRSINSAPTVDMELVLTSSPDVLEMSFPGFLLGGITYTADSVTGELTVESDAVEPFPAYLFTPNYFPGLF